MSLRKWWNSTLLKSIVVLVVFVVIIGAVEVTTDNNRIILFVPQDNRPISAYQSAQIPRALGYNVKMPPLEDLEGHYTSANIDKVEQWLLSQGGNDKIAIIATDTLIYGGLVHSRKHHYSLQEVKKRVEVLKKLHEKYPQMPIYVFSSIMRTPKDGISSGTEDAAYYSSYGKGIATFSKLRAQGKNNEEAIMELSKSLPPGALKDWMTRREINYTVNLELLEYAKQGIITYLLLGRDDNEPGSATDHESKELAKYAETMKLGSNKVRVMSGSDEMALLLMAKVTNELEGRNPKVYVEYAGGKGGNTLPTYSNEPIAKTIQDEVALIDGYEVPAPEQADLVFIVNSTQNGRTYNANSPFDDGGARSNSWAFWARVQELIKSGKPVTIGDIAFANGADNFLLEHLSDAHLLGKLYGYAGWNTATNSTGFALGMGSMTLGMTKEQRLPLLLTRYLDDWAYQANVRQDIYGRLRILAGTGNYLSIDDKRRYSAEIYGNQCLIRFTSEHMGWYPDATSARLTLPWSRIFEAHFYLTK